MKNLNYTEMKEKIEKVISEQRTIILATSDKGKVTARTVYCTSNGLKIFFVTSSAYLKYKQLIHNPSVAMCFSNIQIQGKATVLGHPLEERNQEILKTCSHLDEEFMHWTKYKNSVLIQVDILEVECWNQNGREYLDIQHEKSYRIG